MQGNVSRLNLLGILNTLNKIFKGLHWFKLNFEHLFIPPLSDNAAPIDKNRAILTYQAIYGIHNRI